MGKWWRFNDFQATEETEEIVMRESFGSGGKGESKKTAVSLFYVNDYVAKHQSAQAYNKWGQQNVFGIDI